MLPYDLKNMTSDTKAIIGTIIGTGLVIGGLLNTSINTRIDDARNDLTRRIGDVRTDLTRRIDDVRTDLSTRIDSNGAAIGRNRAAIESLRDDMREDHQNLDTRLRAVEIGFGKVDQRLLTLERILLPPAEPPAR